MRSELEGVIDDVAASYGAGRLIDSLSSAQLPNKRQVIEALNHLKAVTYLGYYATAAVDEAKLHFAVASHLYRSYPKLGIAARHQLRDLLDQATDQQGTPPPHSKGQPRGLVCCFPFPRAEPGRGRGVWAGYG